ncbi:hypothetical protein [Micromonospora coxensis]|uniref:Uncharacterized protein n=1 Tax=Micromonospora coxensis TaxID=356852 RepID=A0A1C5JCK4_9ACTN|nr:hypothetical protein [Micromonospora coxensis]SCG67929.1 hypothetical protein GA0070614_4319 [Micromonospora coxensis]
MHENGVLHQNGSPGRRYPSVPCGRPLTLGATRLAEPVATPEPYRVDELSHTEAAQLVRAKADAEATLVTHHSRVQGAGDRLIDTWRRTKLALHRLEELLSRRELTAAATGQDLVEREHAGDGAEDRRNRPGWQHPLLVWTVIFISAIYDTFFFAQAFRSAIDTGTELSTVESLVSYLPGFGIFMGLVLAGSWLAVPLFRHRSRAERRRWRRRLDWQVVLRRIFVRWRPEDEERRPDELPWPSWVLPVTFTVLMVGILAFWAWLRGDRIQQPHLRWPLVALLVLLTVSAIAFKASAYNPYAERQRRVKRRAKLAGRRYERLRAEAQGLLGAHEKAWQELHLTVEDAANAVRRHLTDAWTEIAEARARHGLTGTVSPAFTTTADDDVTDLRLFEGLTGPSLRLSTLRLVRDLLDRHHPNILDRELTDLLRRLDGQLDVEAQVVAGNNSTGGGPEVHQG